MGMEQWFPDGDMNGGLGARIGPMQVGKNKFSNFGYEPAVAEVDPVSFACQTTR